MALELVDGKIKGSSGVAQAGLTLGIIGTALASGIFNNGNGWGIFGGGQNDELRSEVAQLRAEKYTDDKALDLYTQIVAVNNITEAKIDAVKDQLYTAVLDLDKRTALNEQANRLNREYDATVRDYMMTIVNNKIDCCCDKMNIKADYEKQISELSDASILSYVNSNFLPGILKLPASNISPNVVLA